MGVMFQALPWNEIGNEVISLPEEVELKLQKVHTGIDSTSFT